MGNKIFLAVITAAIACAFFVFCGNSQIMAQDKVFLGVVTGGDSGLPGANQVSLPQFEAQVGKKMSIYANDTWWYTQGWGDFNTLNKGFCDTAWNNGRMPMIIWQPYNPCRNDPCCNPADSNCLGPDGKTHNCTQEVCSYGIANPNDLGIVDHYKKFSLKRIAAGDFDGYIRNWANQIRNWGKPVMMRPMHEMNTTGTLGSCWGNAAYPQTFAALLYDVDCQTKINEPQDAVAAWRRIVDIFRQEKADNAIWVWSVLSWPSAAYGGNNSISLASIFPGDNYVDWIGIECYNTFKESDSDSNWRDCKDIVAPTYREAIALPSSKPLMIVEMGSLEKPGNPSYKSNWITNAIAPSSSGAIINQFPRIKAVIWWNDARLEVGNSSSLAINTSNASVQSFKNAIIGDVYDGQFSLISGRVANANGQPLSNIEIDTCSAGAAITNSAGFWSKAVEKGAGFCARVVDSSLPFGFDYWGGNIKGTGNNTCNADFPTYEWQVAGQNVFTGCSATGQQRLDLASDNSYDFKVNYPACNNWTVVSNLGGVAKFDPVVGLINDRLIVAVIGSDSAAWIREYDLGSGQWSGWYSTGGVLTSQLKIANDNGALALFAIGSDGYVWKEKYNSPLRWDVWENTNSKNLVGFGPDAAIYNGTIYKLIKKQDGSTEISKCEAVCSPACSAGQVCSAGACVAKKNYLHILSSGQSLSFAGIGGAVSTSQPYENLMLSPDVFGTAGPLKPLVENYSNSGFETPASGMADSLYAYDSLKRPVVVGLHGQGGTIYTGLKKGTVPYNNGIAQAAAVKTLIEARGGVYKPIGITIVHGESDAGQGYAGMYESYLKEWQNDYQTDINAIAGSSATLPMFINQMNQLYVAADGGNKLAVAQLNAHKNNPGKIIMVGPKYQYGYCKNVDSANDHLHLTNKETKHVGEMLAKVINKVVFEGKTWDPLMPTKVERNGNIITISYAIPYGQLAIDITNVAKRPNYGFEFHQTGGTVTTISSVALVNNNTQVQLTLNRVPDGTNQRVRYAWTCWDKVSYCGNAADDGYFGGNIRDTDSNVSPEVGSTRIPLYDWSVTFDEPVTNACIPDCSTANAKQCNGNGVQTCTMSGGCLKWSAAVDCGAGKTCSAGVCQNACVPKTCATLGNYQCGNWSDTCNNTINCGTCASGLTCSAGQCVSNCISQTSKKCESGKLYWYNSCNTKEGLFQDCGSDQLTTNYRCRGSWAQRETIKKGCTNNACTRESAWVNAVDCNAAGKICGNGVCVDQSTGGGDGGGAGTIIGKKEEIKPVAKLTRAEILKKINEIMALIAKLQAQLKATTGAQYSCAQISKNLYYGMKNDPQVICLQEVLKAQGYAIIPNGIYDAATKNSVKLFQQKYAKEILTPYGLRYGSGNVGNATMKKLNQIIGNK